MTTKQLSSLAIIFGAALLLVLLFQGVRNRTIQAGGGEGVGESLYSNFPVNEISSLSLQSAGGSLNLERGEEGWSVGERDGYPANFQRVGEFLRTVFELEPVQKIEVGPSKFGRVGLLEPGTEKAEEQEQAMIVSFEAGEKELPDLWLGKEYLKQETGQFGTFEEPGGRYVSLAGSDNVYLVDDAFENAEIDPAQWVSKDFFRVRKVKTIERTAKAAPDESWKLIRESETGDFTLADAGEGEELDNTKVSSMKNAFSSPSFEDVLTGEDVERPGTATFKITTFEGFEYVVHLSEKDEVGEYRLALEVNGSFPETFEPAEDLSDEDRKTEEEAFKEEQERLKAKLAEEKALEGFVYRVRSFVADSVNKTRSEVLKETEAATDAVETPPGGPVPPGE